MDKYIISSGLIFNDKDQILLVKHKPEFESGFYWFVPGGTALENEQAIDALKREVNEETNIDIGSANELIYTIGHTNHKRKWHSDIYVYLIKDWSGDIKINDPDENIVELKWFDKEEAANVINDIPFKVMKEPLITYLKGEKTKRHWLYIEDTEGEIQLLK